MQGGGGKKIIQMSVKEIYFLNKTFKFIAPYLVSTFDPLDSLMLPTYADAKVKCANAA